MALPRTLKDFDVYYQGLDFVGQVTKFNRPKLAINMEEYRAAGVGPVKIDLGLKLLEVEHTYGGHMRDILNDFGGSINNVLLRYCGAYQRDDTDEVDAIEVEMKGRHEEVDPGTDEAGKLTELKIKTVCTYYCERVNGQNVIEIDLLNKQFVVNGKDRWAAIRQALGK